MSIFSKLLGGQTPAPKPQTHNGFRIFAAPEKTAGGFRIAARIEKEIDGRTRTHMMIRVDTLQSLDEAIEATLAKARMLIDQQGETIFD